MSASREAVADASGVTIEKCSCRDCANGGPFIGDTVWCDEWDLGIKASAFCSFFVPVVKCGDGDG